MQVTYQGDPIYTHMYCVLVAGHICIYIYIWLWATTVISKFEMQWPAAVATGTFLRFEHLVRCLWQSLGGLVRHLACVGKTLVGNWITKTILKGLKVASGTLHLFFPFTLPEFAVMMLSCENSSRNTEVQR